MHHRSPVLPRRFAIITGFFMAGATACASSDRTPDGAPPATPAPPPPHEASRQTFPLEWPVAPPALSPELAVGDPILGPAMGEQTWPEAAFNGSSHLVIWRDSRPGGAYAALVAPDGAVAPVLDPLPLRGAAYDVASDGQDFLVIGQGTKQSPGFIAARVGADGSLLGASLISSSQTSDHDLKVASSGAGYLAVWEESDPSGAQTLRTARIALDGAVLDPGGVVLDEGAANLVNASFDGTSYLVAWNTWGPPTMHVAAFDAGGALLQETTLPVFLQAMECDTGGCLAVWAEEATFSDPGGIWASWMTSPGTLLDPQGVQVASTWTGDGRIAAGFAGDSGVIAWSNGTYDCISDNARFTTIAKDGALLGPDGGSLRTNATLPALSWDGERAFAFWSDERAWDCGVHASIYGARITEQGAVLDGDGVLISRSANGQIDPSLAWDGEAFVLTWSDERNVEDGGDRDVYALRLDAGGSPLEAEPALLGMGPRRQAHPRAVFDGSSTLVAWWDCVYLQGIETECYVGGSRLGQGGATWLGFPFLVWDTSPMPPALSSGGGSAVISPFATGAQLETAALGPSGVPGLDPIMPELDFSMRIASASGGEGHLVVWGPDRIEGPLLGARVAPDGAVLDPGGFPVTPPDSVARTFAVASGGGVYLVAWHDSTPAVQRILAARVSPDGAVLDAAPLVVAEHPGCAAALGASALAFDGERFALGWSSCGPESSDLFGALIDVDGAVRARFPITADAHLDEAPALGGTGAGEVLIAYPSFRAEAPLGAWRLYTKHLDSEAMLTSP